MNETLAIDIIQIDPKFLDSAGIQLDGREFEAVEFLLKELDD
jgi:hypothetical protein